MPPSTRRARIVPIQSPKPAPQHPFDRVHGTETGGLIPRTGLLTGHVNDAHITAYYAVAPSILDTLIDLWQQTKPLQAIDRYTFLDIGAGKGRALLAASLHPFRQVTGIELNPELAEIARENLRAFAASPAARPLAPANLLQADALEAPLPSAPALGFMFHPFEAPVLRRFVARIEQHYNRSPGGFDLLYVNAEHAEVLDRNAGFTRLFHGLVPMSFADHRADMAEIAEQTEYGSTGDELCAIYRYTGRPGQPTGVFKRAS